MNESEFSSEHQQLVHAIAALEAQRGVLGDAVVDPMIAAAREKLDALESAGPASPDLRGERRQATILMADVEGSTKLAGQIGTETWVEIMNRVFHLLGDAIYRYGGEIEQYRGDGLIAFFGAKGAHEDDPERAVRAGLAMQAAVIEYAAELWTQYGIELLMRVGINSGEVIAAEVGDRRQHSEDTAMGRAIALAARMESAAQPGTVLVTAHTYHLNRPLFEWQALGEIRVKGVSQPVAVYRPLAAKVLSGKGRGIEGLSSPLVGRDKEVETLRKAVDDLRRGVGGIVTLVGEAGIGKSRLVTEVRTWAREQAESNLPAPSDPGLHSSLAASDSLLPVPQWVEGRCLSYGGSIAYLLWLDMLRSILRVAPDAPAEVVRDALRARVQALCPDCFDAVYPYLCRLLSLPLEDAYAEVRDLQGESLRAEVFGAVQTLTESAAGQQPLVMVCEDLHWADGTSLALLERVLALTDRSALLLICVFRPQVEHGCWQLKESAARLYGHRHTDLWLEALSADESLALVEHLLRIEDLPAALRSKILDRAEGNPFYVEEIIRTLIDGAVEGGPAIAYDETTGQWQATREIAEIPLPDTLHGVLMARIDRLQEETRRVLRLASVIGRVFLYRVLAEIAREEEQLDTRLLTLQRQQLIRERARVPELEYIFKHELTREAAYNGLLDRERRACHRQVAQALEQLFPTQVDELAGLLAHHWERAEEPHTAVAYLLKAGEQARLAYANQEAIDCLKRALALMEDWRSPPECRPEWRLAALSGLGKVYYDSGRVSDAEAPLREALALAKAIGRPVRERVRLSWWLGESLFWQQRFEDMLELGEAGLALLADEDETLEVALMNQVVAIASGWTGDPERYSEFTQRTARFLQDLAYVEELRPAYTHVVEDCVASKREQEALHWLKAHEARAEGAHHLRGLGEVYELYGYFDTAIGDVQQAVGHYRRAIEFYSRIGDAKKEAYCLTALAQSLLSLGHIPEAERHLERALELVHVEDFTVWMSRLYRGLGTVKLCQARWGEALEVFENGCRFAQELERPSYDEASCKLCLGYIYLAQGKHGHAGPLFESAIRLLGPHGWPGEGIAALLSGLERAYADPQRFQEFCRRCRLEHRAALNACPQQWHLEPATPRAMGEPWLVETFADPLSPAWVWTDRFGDCSYQVHDGLDLYVANGRFIWHMNCSAPRVLRQASGDFIVETTSVPAMDDRPTIGGLLLWKDQENYLCLVRGLFGDREITFTGCVADEEAIFGRGGLYERAERVILRLVRAGSQVNALCSTNGIEWHAVGQAAFSVQDPVQIGVCGYAIIDRLFYPGAYLEGTAIRFESFQMWVM